MIYSSVSLIAASGAAGKFERKWPLPRSGQRLLAVLTNTVATRMPTAIVWRRTDVVVLFSITWRNPPCQGSSAIMRPNDKVRQAELTLSVSDHRQEPRYLISYFFA
jgi:hypothetical protein